MHPDVMNAFRDSLCLPLFPLQTRPVLEDAQLRISAGDARYVAPARMNLSDDAYRDRTYRIVPWLLREIRHPAYDKRVSPSRTVISFLGPNVIAKMRNVESLIFGSFAVFSPLNRPLLACDLN